MQKQIFVSETFPNLFLLCFFLLRQVGKQICVVLTFSEVSKEIEVPTKINADT